jgi:pimeloyl-ACP methyl ester carboxylesterase
MRTIFCCLRVAAANYRMILAPLAVAALLCLLAGDDDATASPRIHAQALAAAVPNAKLIMLVGVGHMPQYDAPERVAGAIAEIAGQGTQAK